MIQMQSPKMMRKKSTGCFAARMVETLNNSVQNSDKNFATQKSTYRFMTQTTLFMKIGSSLRICSVRRSRRRILTEPLVWNRVGANSSKL